MGAQSYVLMTSAQNEENYIEQTIQSVCSQSTQPRAWVIVDDGSTDATTQIVRRYVEKHNFIRLLQKEPRRDRDFASKARALNQAYGELAGSPPEGYRYIGVLDADVVLPPDYYRQVIARFEADPDLGIAGGMLFETWKGRQEAQFFSPGWSVSGPIQVFRRQCFESVGGFRPIPVGGEDCIVQVMARMNGWKVQAFPEIQAVHLRRTGTAGRGIWSACIRRGVQDYLLGYNPLFFFAKSIAHFAEKPYLVCGLAMLWGFLGSMVRNPPKPVPDAVIRFQRREQISRILLKARLM